MHRAEYRADDEEQQGDAHAGWTAARNEQGSWAAPTTELHPETKEERAKQHAHTDWQNKASRICISNQRIGNSARYNDEEELIAQAKSTFAKITIRFIFNSQNGW